MGWRFNIIANLTGKPRNADFKLTLVDIRGSLRSTD